jgi:hypothetical protein
MSVLSPEEKKSAVRVRVYCIIKKNLKFWSSRRDVYQDIIYNLQYTINTMLAESTDLVHAVNFNPQYDSFTNGKIPEHKKSQIKQTESDIIKQCLESFDSKSRQLTDDNIIVLIDWLNIMQLW